MSWQTEVWLFTIAGKSRRGNWYEGRFRWMWTAYLAARTMAIICDLLTPTRIVVDDEVQESPYGIRWGIRRLGSNHELQEDHLH
jgi:hypothetical protein